MYNPIAGVGDGTAPVVNLSFDWLSQADVVASVDGVPVDYTWTGASQITFSAAVASGTPWRVERVTSINEPLVDFTDGSFLTEADLDRSQEQNLHALQELRGNFETFEATLLPTSAGPIGVSMLDDMFGGPTGLDVRVPLQAAIDYVGDNGGGVVFVPAGTWQVSKNPSHSYAINVRTGVTLRGEGYSTVIQLAPSEDATVLNLLGVSKVRIADLVVDGNRAEQTVGAAAHGIRLESVSDSAIQGVKVMNANSYGIGMQAGTMTNILLDDLDVQNTGSDGIDIKNHNDDNSGIFIRNIRGEGWAIDGSGDVLLDIRGPAHLAHIHGKNPGSDEASGIRFRDGELLSTNGLGGHNSTLVDFTLEMGTADDGVRIEARNVDVIGGKVFGGLRGLYVLESGSRVTNVSVNGTSGDGVVVAAVGGGLDADGAVLVNVRSEGNAGDGFQIDADGVQLIGPVAMGNTGTGIVISSTADGTKIVGARLTGNAAQVSDAGVNTQYAATPIIKTYTVAQLASQIPTPFKGQRAFVVDATATTFNSVVAGGGSNDVPVFYEDGNWRIG